MADKKVPLKGKGPSEPIKLIDGETQSPKGDDLKILPGGGEVGGPGVEVVRITDTLPTEKNPQTGSIFYHVADSDDFGGAIRFWRETSMPDRTVIAFRFRLTPKLEVANLLHYAAAKWPDIKWSGGGATHLSVSGATAYKVSPMAYEQVCELAHMNDIGGKIFDSTAALLPGLTMNLTREQFVQFYMEQLAVILEVPKSDLPEKSKAVVFEFASYKAKLQNGQEMDTGAEDVGL